MHPSLKYSNTFTHSFILLHLNTFFPHWLIYYILIKSYYILNNANYIIIIMGTAHWLSLHADNTRCLVNTSDRVTATTG